MLRVLFLVSVGLFLLVPSCSQGAMFARAKVTKIHKKVSVLKGGKKWNTRPAKLNETLKADQFVQTGGGSRAELRFNDETLVRLGSNTFFSFKNGTRRVDLDRGNLLFQVQKGRGNMRVATAAVTAAITGTTGLVSARPKKSYKVIILEGRSKVYLNKSPKQFKWLGAGQMITIRHGAKRLPDPVDIEIRETFETAGLIKKMGKGLRLAPLRAAMAEQDKLKKEGNLVEELAENPPGQATEVPDITNRAVEAQPSSEGACSSQGGGGRVVSP